MRGSDRREGEERYGVPPPDILLNGVSRNQGSTAASGDLERGSFAMRRAMRIDPDALHYLVLDETLRGRIDQLVQEYDARDRTAADSDTAFMLAALYYLRGDIDAARTAVEHAVVTGDRSASAAGLHLLEVLRSQEDEPLPDSLIKTSDLDLADDQRGFQWKLVREASIQLQLSTGDKDRKGAGQVTNRGRKDLKKKGLIYSEGDWLWFPPVPDVVEG